MTVEWDTRYIPHSKRGGIDNEEIRRRRRAIWCLINIYPEPTAYSISKRLKISYASVTRVVKILHDLDLIKYVEGTQSGRFRKIIQIVPNSDKDVFEDELRILMSEMQNTRK